ncbi:MAG TPA: diguanylate cyclase [Baekduia sp.]|nr:diguanylate cyclase [Baekduia sp.]
MSPRRPTGDLRDRLFSFRVRLRLFFLLIVVVPMVAVTLVVFRLISDSEHGQGDARVAARQEAAISLYYAARQRADRIAARVGRDPQLAGALRAGTAGEAALRRRVRVLLRSTGADRVRVVRGGRVLADAGDPRATFPAARSLVSGGHALAAVQVSVMDAERFVRNVRSVTGLEAVVRRGEEVLGTTLAGAGAGDVALPSRTGAVHIGGRSYRAASFTVPGFSQERLQVTVLESAARTEQAIRGGRLVAGFVLAGFFLLALVAAGIVSRALQNQIDALLGAARRIAGGDLSARVPARGRDEFAQLGDEFNKMSAELERRMQELAQERVRLELSLRRIGETFASGFDARALLEIMVRTAVDAVDADGGEAQVCDEGGELAPVARRGGAPPAALAEAERRALATGEPAIAEVDGVHALAHPLPPARPATGVAGGVGVLAMWRAGRPFAHRERELFHYLGGQAAVSIENAALHEAIERRAVTDELTGLANRRRFQEVIDAEVERARRLGQGVGLVLLDIDDFKAVNDTYGHQQGDLVLREVAAVLRATSREIDEPARYGGEELVIVLPGTDLDGAHRLAERVREGVEALRIPVLGDDAAAPLRITASLGAAAAHGSDAEVRALIAAADEALYQAKRGGKNRTVGAA